MAQLFVVPGAINTALIYSGPVIAVWRGRWRARLLGAAIIVQYVVQRLFPINWQALRPGPLGVQLFGFDLLELALVVICLRRATRYWVVWAGAIILVDFAVDALFVSPGHLSGRTFVSASRIWAYAMTAVLIWGAFADERDVPAAG